MIIAATMDPKPETLQQNVALKFRNLKVTRADRLLKTNRSFRLIECKRITGSLFLNVLSPILFLKVDHTYFQVADGKRSCMFWSGYSEKK